MVGVAGTTVNETPAKVWILAGEASGDLYGAGLARELRRRRPDVPVAGMGGPEMRAAGVEILVDSTELGVVGLIEVAKHFPLFWRLFHGLVARAAAERPALVVLIDYPGFNLRFAKQMRALDIPVVYYVSPQVWAWGKGRVPRIAKLVKRMLVIFPFEESLYTKVGLPTRFVGHPLVDLLTGAAQQTPVTREPNLVLLLPGSRFSEVDRLLAPMVATADALAASQPHLRFVIATPRPAVRDRVQERLARLPRPGPAIAAISVACGDTPILMRRASAGLAASGTVTVQCAILGLPLVVVYRVNCVTYWLGRLLINVPYITMVNLVAGARVFEEYLQGDVRPAVLAPAMLRILPGGARRQEALAGMAQAVAALGGPGQADAAAAREILAELDAATKS